MTCVEGRVMVGHYYPYCPQPDLTVGLAYQLSYRSRVQQDHVGGLQFNFVLLILRFNIKSIIFNIQNHKQIKYYYSTDYKTTAHSKHIQRSSPYRYISSKSMQVKPKKKRSRLCNLSKNMVDRAL